jgi:hypothetical protein
VFFVGAGGRLIAVITDAMPLQYERDDIRHRLRVTLADPFSATDLIASVERQFAEGAWRYGLLVDARSTFQAPQPTDMRSFVASLRALITAHGPRGPVAIVAKKSGTIIGAQLYSFFSQKMEPVETFWDIDDAQQWLDERIAQGRDTPESD